MSGFTPFADDTATMAIGEFNMENGTLAVSFFGTLDITRDRVGLDHARKLAGLLGEIVRSLENVPDLPAAVALPKEAGDKVRNPFN